MKTPLLPCLAGLLALLLTSAPTQAQTLVTGPGYWNVETNQTTRNNTIIRFYNDQHQLVYEEQLPSLCLDLSGGTGLCRRTSRRLDYTLRQVLQNPALAAQTDLLAQQFGQDRRVQRVYAVR